MVEISTAAAQSVYSIHSLFTIMVAVVSLSQPQCVCLLSVLACQRDEGDENSPTKQFADGVVWIMYSGNARTDCSLACTVTVTEITR